MRKHVFCICENKSTDELSGNQKMQMEQQTVRSRSDCSSRSSSALFAQTYLSEKLTVIMVTRGLNHADMSPITRKLVFGTISDQVRHKLDCIAT